MSDDGHNYSFSMNTKTRCKFCDSEDHWALHCPEKNKEEKD